MVTQLFTHPSALPMSVIVAKTNIFTRSVVKVVTFVHGLLLSRMLHRLAPSHELQAYPALRQG
jgi:hypothetical protein